MHASIQPINSKPNVERGLHSHESAPSQPDLSTSPQPINNVNPSLVIPPPSRFDDIPPIVPPPPTFEGDSLLPAATLSNSQPNYIFINNINEFGGLPAAIRTANYVRPDSTYEIFSEAFFDKNAHSDSLKYENQKIPKAEVGASSQQPHFAYGPTDVSSTRYHLATSEVQNRVNVDGDEVPQERIEKQYDLVFEKESVEEIPFYPLQKSESKPRDISSPPPPLPKTAPPPLLNQSPPSISKYINLLSPSKPQTPPKPVPVVDTNMHAGGSDAGKRRVFGQQVILMLFIRIFNVIYKN